MKAISALLEGDKDMALAWNAFYTQVFTNLYKILKEDQHEKFRDYVNGNCGMNSRFLQEMGIHHMNGVSREKRLYVFHRDIHQVLSCLQSTPRNMRRNADIFGL